MLVTRMVITMVHFNGAAHHKRSDNYSLGITALSCWRCENFFPLFVLFPSYSLVGSACCSLFSNHFPGTCFSFVIPMFKFVADQAIWKISETLDANYLGSQVLFPGRIVATIETVEIYKKSIQHT